MISGINIHYAGISYLNRPEAKATTTEPQIQTLRDNKTNNVLQSAEFGQSSNEVTPQQQVTQDTLKTQKTVDKQVTIHPADNWSPDDIASFISTVERTRQMSKQETVSTLSQVLPTSPQSQGQLILQDLNANSIQTNELLTQLVHNFNLVDTDKNHLISFEEAVSFLNRV